MINGCKYDSESISVNLPSGEAIGITDISYNDEKSVEPRYGLGALPRGYGRKNYKASGSMTLDREEFQRLAAALGGSFYRAQPFPITVTYANDDMPTITDTLPNCKLTKVDASVSSDSENAGQCSMDFVILEPIKWGGSAAYQE